MATVDLFHAEDTELTSFRAGQEIFREGEPGDLMYVVREGEVTLRVKGQVVETLGPGGVLGEMALIEHAPRTATAAARTDCKLVPIPESRFMLMVSTRP